AGGCDGRPVLLSGYSQGAEVVVRAVGRLSAVEQAGVTVALFGNPSYLPGQPGDYPGDSLATGIRPSFRHVALRLPPAVRRRTIDVCATGDPVCGVDPDRTSVVGKVEFVLTHVHIHTHEYAFGPEGYAAIAAKFLWDHRTH
ncbi:MAG TPA: cutinase family protein, partial [Streptomyces sp.]